MKDLGALELGEGHKEVGRLRIPLSYNLNNHKM